MARMPGVPFLGVTGNGAMTTWDIVCVHTIVGLQHQGNAAHFTTGANGTVVQARDTNQRSAANLNGNWHVIAIENEDFGSAYGTWSGSNVPGFTDAQAEAIARILVWCHQTHGIPLELVPDSRVGRRGIAYHRQGIDGNFGGYAYGGRVVGGELWSSSFGKVCPGDRRITQLINEIIPRARVLAGLQEETLASSDEILSAVRGYGQRTERIDQGMHGGWGYGRRIENAEAGVARLESAVAAIRNQLGTPVPVQVDAASVAAALAGNDQFLVAIAKAVADENARRLAA